jgi:hypothetical protein
LEKDTPEKIIESRVERSWLWWYWSITPVTQEVEVRGLWSEAGPGKMHTILSEKQAKAKGLRA